MGQLLNQPRTVSASTTPALTVPASLRNLYAPVLSQLERVNILLYEELCNDHPFVDQLVKHGFRLGGKRLRPALVLLSGQVCGPLGADHFTLGAAVELIHTATLIHDDVLDEATLRRHLDTINARWDNEASILLGDYLFARSICQVSTLSDPFALRELSRTARIMCEGELRQVGHRGNYQLAEEEYLTIIGSKTAELIALCCRLGAYYSGASTEDCQALGRYGSHLGVAFQIADDVLDLTGDENTAGKSLGTDLLKQKATLPLICLLGRVEPHRRPELEALLAATDNHRTEALRPWLERYGAIEAAQAQAGEYSRRAAAELRGLPAGPARDALAGLTEFVVHRTL
ncbi:MAG: polyprenyl synthetase family protein [Pirellulales bacterium]|nr:polyprenyl synthetase family protein [Pirellulales bacterium]